MVDPKTIVNALLEAMITYPEAGYDEETIEEVAVIWSKNLSEAAPSNEEFEKAFLRVCTGPFGGYFPKTNEMIKEIKNIRQIEANKRIDAKERQLPEPVTACSPLTSQKNKIYFKLLKSKYDYSTMTNRIALLQTQEAINEFLERFPELK
jgi:hypothetical protein